MTPTASSFHLTRRDERILDLVYLYDGASVDLVHQRLWPPASTLSSCYRRIALLLQHGYLTAQRLTSLSGVGSGKRFLTIGPSARPLLATWLGIPKSCVQPRMLTSSLLAAHHCAICFLRVCLELACESTPDLQLPDWRTEAQLRQQPVRLTDIHTAAGRQQTRILTIVPDAAFTLVYQGKEQLFYLEQDQGTVSLSRVAMKLRAYMRLRQQLQTAAAVLVVTTTTIRRDQILQIAREQAAEVGAKPTSFFVTTQGDINSETVLTQSIWYQPGLSIPTAITPDLSCLRRTS